MIIKVIKSKFNKTISFDFGFEEVSDVSALQPFSGDILIEGSSVINTQGYTPSGTQTTQTPS